MPNIISADNGVVSGSAGLKSTADSSGTLDIRTGSGTTAISIDASQAVTIPGNLTVSGTLTASGAGGNYIFRSYVAPATWTKPANLKAIKVTVVGAGGAGGSSSPGFAGMAGGGGGGGSTIDYIPAPSIPGPVAVTAGPGTNSFGAFCSATAGSAGTNGGYNPGPGAPSIGSGGAGGSGSGGELTFVGSSGLPGIPTTGAGIGCLAGSSAIFSNMNLTVSGQNVNGVPGIIGGGGSGAGPRGPAPGTGTGGTGGPGVVIVEEFY